MKRYIVITAAIAALMATSCTKEATYDFVPDVAWTSYLSTTDSSVSHTKTSATYVGDYALFRDASIGAVSHEWEISGNARMVSDPSDLASVIDGTKSSSDDMYIVFEGSGEVTVTLRNQFDRKVVSTTAEAVESIYQEETGLWLFEKVYTLESYCDLAPGYTIFKIALDGEQSEILTVDGNDDVDAMETTRIELVKGEKLFFDYNEESEYRSTSQTWTVPNISADEDNEATFTFNEVTTSDITGITLLAMRDEISSFIPATKSSVDVPIAISVVDVIE